MTITPAIERAIHKASILHNGQVRKGEDDLPYVTHLFSVAALLSMYADNEEVIVAGLLHDSLEDTPYRVEELEAEFGKKVREIVESVTEASASEKEKQMFSWKERKSRYLEKLKSASAEALMVSAADKIHNFQTLIDNHKEDGPAIWKNFKQGKDEYLWFLASVLVILEDRLQSPIVSKLRDVFNEAEIIFKEEKII